MLQRLVPWVYLHKRLANEPGPHSSSKVRLALLRNVDTEADPAIMPSLLIESGRKFEEQNNTLLPYDLREPLH